MKWNSFGVQPPTPWNPAEQLRNLHDDGRKGV
jgi:hypothetical protein